MEQFSTVHTIKEMILSLSVSLTHRVLLVSTGLWDPQKVQFEGSDLVEGYESIPVDPEEYKDQAVLILGKGNSAFETAQSILGRASRIHLYSPSPVRLAWQTHYVGDLRYWEASSGFDSHIVHSYQLFILLFHWFSTPAAVF